jgi:hypothetical protein
MLVLGEFEFPEGAVFATLDEKYPEGTRSDLINTAASAR